MDKDGKFKINRTESSPGASVTEAEYVYVHLSVPMPDPVLGERMCACAILRRGAALTLQELVAFLMNEEIAKHKLPERLETLDDFPLSPFGKVSKKDLTERIARKLKEEGRI